MCGGAWETVAVGHWVPVQSPICHKRVGLICSDCWIELKLTYVVPCVSRIVDRSPGYSEIAKPRSVTTAPSLETPAQPTSTTIAPALMDHVPAGPGGTTDTISVDGTGASGSQPAKKNTRGPCRQLKTAKVTRVTSSRISIGYNERHRVASTAELHSSLAHDIGHVVRTHCPMQWKSWNVMPDEIKMETNENLEDLDDESLAYVNRLFAETYKQWKSDLHHHFEAFDDPQAPDYVNKAQVNKGNRKKKTLITIPVPGSLAHDIGHVVRTHCPMQWKSWNVMPDEIKMETNENLEDLDDESLAYVNRLFAETYKQWKSDLHHHFEAFDDPQAPDYVNKAQVNKGNRKKKTLITIPVPGSLAHDIGHVVRTHCPMQWKSWNVMPDEIKMETNENLEDLDDESLAYVNRLFAETYKQWKSDLHHHFEAFDDPQGGPKFPEIDVFGDVYVRPGNELAESLHTTMVERSQLVLQESTSPNFLPRL
ncbi:unnamed protein product [Prunus armeniaca]